MEAFLLSMHKLFHRKTKKGITITHAFKKMSNESDRKPCKRLVDQWKHG